MPLIEIKALKPRADVDAGRALKNAAWELAKVLGVPPEKVRAVWIPVECYAEGDKTISEQPSDTHPPIVSVYAFEGRPPALVEKAILCVAENVCRDLKLAPGNVWVHYTSMGAGTLYIAGAMKT